MERRVFLYPYAGPEGRNYLKQLGTLQDIKDLGVELAENARIPFYCDDGNDVGEPDDLYFDGTAHFDPEQQSWYVLVDESSYRQASSEAS